MKQIFVNQLQKTNGDPVMFNDRHDDDVVRIDLNAYALNDTYTVVFNHGTERRPKVEEIDLSDVTWYIKPGTLEVFDVFGRRSTYLWRSYIYVTRKRGGIRYKTEWQKMASNVPILLEKEEQLSKLGYFDCPAAAKYHLAERGGLAKHSCNVAKRLVQLTENNNLKWERDCSPIIIGLLHDLCKTMQYTIDADGVVSYKENVDWRHGELSVELAQEILGYLTDEEKMCISMHMGVYASKDILGNADAIKGLYAAYGAAFKAYPNLGYVCLADMLSSQIDEANK